MSVINITKDTLFLWGIGVGQTVIFALLFLYLNSNKTDEGKQYVSKNALVLGISIAIEFLIYLITYEGDVIGKDIHLGWGISNSIAMILLMLIPLTFYLYLKNQDKGYVLTFITIDILLIILMLSKGAYLTLLIISIPLLIISLLVVKYKRRLFFDGLMAIAIFLLLILFISRLNIITEGIFDYLLRMGGRGWFNDKARIEIYSFGLDIFKKFPLFGAGSYSNGYYLVTNGFNENLKHYHNYIIQTLATIGLVGMISFIYLIFVFIKNTLRKSPYHLCTFIAILAMLIHGLVDNTWYNPIVMIIIIIYLSQLTAEKID